jgi:hypothetical protein
MWGSKSKGSPKSLEQYLRKCGKVGNYKKYCRSKKVDKEKGYDDTSSTEVKTSME